MEKRRPDPESILLFDAECAPCSRVAKRLKVLNVSGLETRSLNDPEITEILGRGGHQIPTKPTLLDIDGGAVKLHQGLPMRLKLAKRIGFRNAGAIIGLLAAEGQARVERAGTQTKAISRRRLMGGAAAAGVGAVVFGTAAPAQANQGAEVSVGKLSVVDADRLRSHGTIAQALRVWGEDGTDTIHTLTRNEGARIAAVNHEVPGTVTYFDPANQGLVKVCCAC